MAWIIRNNYTIVQASLYIKLHMANRLWVLLRTDSKKQFFGAPKTKINVKTAGYIYNFMLKHVYLDLT